MIFLCHQARAIVKGASFADVSVQQTEETLIDVSNGVIKNCFQGSNKGVCVRLLFNGSWGFSSSTTPENKKNLRTAVDKALDIAGSRGVLKDKVSLADVKPSIAKVPLNVKEDPRNVSLSEKCCLILDLNKEISGSDTSYRKRSGSFYLIP